MRQYVVDAFTDRVFAGNPAAVCVMEAWLPDEMMLSIAKENNLSETAFAVGDGAGYRLRWFTPGGEVDLCGHATLATAYVIFNFYRPELKELHFKTQGGLLRVARQGDLLEMDFPAYGLKQVEVTQAMAEAIGVRPLEAYLARDLLCVLASEAEVRQAKPDPGRVAELPGLLLHITAPGQDFDCVSRSFAPKLNIAEDPVCGSGHCHIAPYWAKKLGKKDLLAYQASARGGTLYCRYEGERVVLGGKAVLFSTAELNLN